MPTIHSFFEQAVAEQSKSVMLPHDFTSVWQEQGVAVACQKKGRKMQLTVFLRCGLYTTRSENFWRDDEKTPAKTLASICVGTKHLQQATLEMSELARSMQAAYDGGCAVVSVEEFGPDSEGQHLRMFNDSGFVFDLPKSYTRRAVRKNTEKMQAIGGADHVRLHPGQVTDEELTLMRRASANVNEQQLLRYVMNQKWSAELSNDQLIAVTAEALANIDNTGLGLEQALRQAKEVLV